ncbi:MAG: hypothetical protein IPM26_12185 [Saprospiraceae bacterium]|nr:hypothetical protein [Saprospiraceae bacterium]
MFNTLSGCSAKHTTHLSAASGINPSEIEVNVFLAEIDKLGNLYVVTDKNILIKYDKNNREKYRYANKRSGRITQLDVSNPLKILLFFDDFNYLLVLDATLTEVIDFKIEDFGMTDITAAAIANDDNYWVYDPVQFRLLKSTTVASYSHNPPTPMILAWMARIYPESENPAILSYCAIIQRDFTFLTILVSMSKHWIYLMWIISSLMVVAFFTLPEICSGQQIFRQA